MQSRCACVRKDDCGFSLKEIALRLTTCNVSILGYIEYRADGDSQMPRTTTMTVRLSGALSEYVSANVGEAGSYENISEYIRDLIRRDKERTERQAFERLGAELARAFATPDSSYSPLSATDVISRNKA